MTIYDFAGRVLISVKNAACLILRPLFDFLYPPYCVLCDRYADDNNRYVCSACNRELARLADPVLTADKINAPGDSELFFDRLVSVFEYNLNVQKLVHLFKYRDQPGLARFWGKQFEMIDPLLWRGLDFIVPVPLHALRMRERGYNQSEKLARQISLLSGIPVQNRLLMRTRYTAPQAKYDRQARVNNLKGGFVIKDPMICTGKDILLIDDVVTTGSTVNECARVLKAAGVKNITVLSIARVDKFI